MTSDNSGEELEIFNQIVSSLSRLDREAQIRLLQTVATFLQIDSVEGGKKPPLSVISTGSAQQELAFSERDEMPPKEFILEKQPRTEAERITCLAYYLTHYRDIPHFKTLDLSKLNTESAQQKFSNTAQISKNATRAGMLVPASKGMKQLSALGEQFIQALPDRQAAKEVLNRLKPRRTRKVPSKKRTSSLKKATDPK